MSSTLAAFLRARIADELADALAAIAQHDADMSGAVGVAALPGPTRRHVLAHGPYRTVADCAARAGIVDAHDRYQHRCPVPVVTGPAGLLWDLDDHPGCWTLLLLARVHADHPNFDPAWAPLPMTTDPTEDR